MRNMTGGPEAPSLSEPVLDQDYYHGDNHQVYSRQEPPINPQPTAPPSLSPSDKWRLSTGKEKSLTE